MSHTSTIEKRYAVVMEANAGVPNNIIRKKYLVEVAAIKRWVRRYELYGLPGLSDKKASHYPDKLILNAVCEYETKALSLEEVCLKYDVRRQTFRRWLEKYERYRAGDMFAFNGGRTYKADSITPDPQSLPTPNPSVMPETEARRMRRKALSKLSKKELYELLLDKEAELEILKKVKALVEEREARKRGTWRESSED